MVTFRIHCAPVRGSPESPQPFSSLQAVTQALQPSPHLLTSISMPQRFAAEAGAPGVPAETPDAPKA